MYNSKTIVMVSAQATNFIASDKRNTAIKLHSKPGRNFTNKALIGDQPWVIT